GRVGGRGIVVGVGGGGLVVAAVLLLRVGVEGRIQTTAESVPRRELLVAGFRIVAKQPKPRLIVGLITAQGFVRGCLNVLIVVGTFRLLGAGEGAVGYLTAALGVGGLIGSFSAMRLQGRPLAVPPGIALIFFALPIP